MEPGQAAGKEAPLPPDDESPAEAAHPGPPPSWILGGYPALYLNMVSYAAHAGTYLMPTLLPYVAAAYRGQEQELLVWILGAQQAGESLGRISTPRSRRVLATGLAGGTMTLIFAFFALVARRP